MNEDYLVRFGSDTPNRTFYMAKEEAEKIYDKIMLDTKTTWKELIHEPLDEDDTQYVIKNEGVKVLRILGVDIAVPEK